MSLWGYLGSRISFKLLVSLLPHSDLLREFSRPVGFIHIPCLFFKNFQALLLTEVLLLIIVHLKPFFALMQLV